MASTDDILSLFHQCFDYSSTVYADYAKRTDSVLSGKETDISSIELLLDSLLDFCFDDRFVYLYKRICRYLLPNYPQLVGEHITIFKKLYGDDIMDIVDGVKLFLVILGSYTRQLGSVAFAVDMNTATADRTLRV